LILPLATINLCFSADELYVTRESLLNISYVKDGLLRELVVRLTARSKCHVAIVDYLLLVSNAILEPISRRPTVSHIMRIVTGRCL